MGVGGDCPSASQKDAMVRSGVPPTAMMTATAAKAAGAMGLGCTVISKSPARGAEGRSCRRPGGRQAMVRLIRDEPVRAPGVHPQLVEVGQKWGEEARPIVEGPSQEVHHDVLVRRL